MAEALSPDICVIGGGPGGIAAARTAAQAGAQVVLVEKRAMGGANLLAGAIPLAALMAAASLFDALRRGPSLGVSGAPLQVNLNKTREHIAAVRAGVGAAMSPEHLAAEGIKVIIARARFVSQGAVSAGETVIRARRFILAVGGRPALPDLPGLTNVEPLTPGDAFDFARKPSHILVLGGTADGLALAQAHQRLGVDATVIDEGGLLPEADPELARVLMARLMRDGVRFRLNSKIERITRRRGGVRVALRDPDEGDIVIDASHILVAGGRKPAVDGLGLEAAEVKYDDAGVIVRNFRTANRRIYAIGDAIPGSASVLRAEMEARAVVHGILYRLPIRADDRQLPLATLTDPPLANIGVGEAEARRRHRNIRLWRASFSENERGAVEGNPDGALKVIATAGGRVLGAAAIGRDAAEHIALWSLALRARLPLSAMARLSTVYPSRADVARVLAASAGVPRLTAAARKRIIRLLGKFG
jgi:pyruvate/2-oxoglutarate dehydrogenase complex dihydrolipoamide dehydrogenase (E3) component